MKKITILEWEEPDPDSPDMKTLNTLDLFELLFLRIPPRDQPSGIEGFRIMQSLVQEIDKVRNGKKKRKHMILDDKVYEWFIKEAQSHIAVRWAFNEKLSKVVDSIFDAEDYKPND